MRLGLLGPAEGNIGALAAGARLLLDRFRVDRAVYLGVDGVLDQVIEEWASELVQGDAAQSALWARAAAACVSAAPADIDRFIEIETARRRLKIFEALPDAETRVVEMLGETIAVMIYDKGNLNEEDMLPARLLLFGKGNKPLVKQVGPRWFLSPGSFSTAGILVLKDEDQSILLTLCDHSGQVIRTERLAVTRGARMRVSGTDA